MSVLYLGVDVSKGYADFCFLSASGRPLGPVVQFDDTPAGHAALRTLVVRQLARCQAQPAAAEVPGAVEGPSTPVRLVAGVEASGGLERNWLQRLRSLPTDLGAAPDSRVYQLNALAVKRFRDQQLHQSVTDAGSARTIAAFLHAGRHTPHHTAPHPTEAGLLTRYRFTQNCIARKVQVQNELQGLLPVVHPDLVPYTKNELPEWVLRLLVRYPTAAQLARARPATVAQIPYVTRARATELIAAARQSVASLGGPHVGATVRALAQDLLRRAGAITALKAALGRELAADRTVQLLDSIPGIGLWTAVALRLELGPLDRFANARAVIAFAGLDPHYHQSGDGEWRLGISKRGRAGARAALHMSMKAALHCNPAVQAYYARLRAAGKKPAVALCACMAQLLRIGYACVVRGERFDPTRHLQGRPGGEPAGAELPAAAGPAAEVPVAEASPSPPAAAPGPSGTAPVAEPGVEPACGSLRAPISRREAQKRKAATRPQVHESGRVRGPGAAPVGHDTASGAPPRGPKKSRKPA